MTADGPTFTTAGLFAGIGGLERGFELAGGETKMLCEVWEPASKVLAAHWPDVRLRGDVRDVRALPKVDVLSAGFPCTDLSQAGRMAGIGGEQSGLVGEVFRLLGRARPKWLVLENVRNMLALDGGRAMRFLVDELEALGYRWAYRLVDSRSAGVPQRRQRVLFVASRTEDPSGVLFPDDVGEPDADEWYSDDAYGFYWTEGLKGLGWARDAVPTLKGGSALGIPSAPAIWIRDAALARQFILPTIGDAEEMQGFPRGWTLPVQVGEKRNGPRWKLVGNAVTVGMAKWLGGRLASPGVHDAIDDTPLAAGAKWPTAARGERGQVWRVARSFWPMRSEYTHLLDMVDRNAGTPLSERATLGFLSRAERSTLRFDPEFLVALKEHARAVAA